MGDRGVDNVPTFWRPLRGLANQRVVFHPGLRGLALGYTLRPLRGVRVATNPGLLRIKSCYESGSAALKMMLLQVTPPSAF